jgi:hypothetical protein
MAKYKTIIGRAESLDLPARLLTDIPAKTDTGAYYSSIHATDIVEVEKKNGKKVLSFKLLGNHPSYPYSRDIEVKSYSKTTVENSFGDKQERYKVEFKVRIAGKLFRTPFTLADRTKKVFPVLLGKTLLNKRYLVDTDIANIDRKLLKVKLTDWLKKDDQTDDEEVNL